MSDVGMPGMCKGVLYIAKTPAFLSSQLIIHSFKAQEAQVKQPPHTRTWSRSTALTSHVTRPPLCKALPIVTFYKLGSLK